jgi:G3E family GTPase
MQDKIRTTVITGFLGAGKTTLLNHLVSQPTEKFALLVNEVSSVHIDEALIERSDEEMIELADGGICCSIRGDLRDALLRIAKRRRDGALSFDRLLIETTGVADPGPILQTFYFESAVEQSYQISSVVTVIDASHLERQLTFQENVNQIGFADVLVLSKMDLIKASERETLIALLRERNPSAAIVETEQGQLESNRLFETFHFPKEDPVRLSQQTDQMHQSVEDFKGLTIVEERPLNRNRFGMVLREVLEAYAEDLYRYKGIIHFADTERKVILQGTGMIYGTAIREPFSEQPKTTLVFIGKGLDEQAIRKGFEAATEQG